MKEKKISVLFRKPYFKGWEAMCSNIELTNKIIAQKIKDVALNEVERVRKESGFCHVCIDTEGYVNNILKQGKVKDMEKIFERAYFDFLIDTFYTYLYDIIFNRLSDFAKTNYPNIFITNMDIMNFAKSQTSAQDFLSIKTKFKKFLLTK